MMAIARAVVPNLKQVALIRTPPSDQTIYGDIKNDILAQGDSVDVIDFAGLPMTELRRRVASLPHRTAILYTAIHSDGQGTHYPPAEALALFAGAANAPIVGASETFVGRGAVGGFVMVPTKIGEEAARLALRILDGESPSHIPATVGQSVQPIFDWNQMQRWRLHEFNLPPGSEIRFRDPSLWERYAGRSLQ